MHIRKITIREVSLVLIKGSTHTFGFVGSLVSVVWHMEKSQDAHSEGLVPGMSEFNLHYV